MDIPGEWERLEGKMLGLQAVKMKINCVALDLWEVDDCSLQRQSLEAENIPTSAVGPANCPSMAQSQSHSSLT